MSKGGCPYCGSTSYMWIDGQPTETGWHWIKTEKGNTVFYFKKDKDGVLNLIGPLGTILNPKFNILAHSPIQEPEEC